MRGRPRPCRDVCANVGTPMSSEDKRIIHEIFDRDKDIKENHITYTQLKQCPRAKKILSKFSPETEFFKSTIAEKSHFDQTGTAVYDLFFGCTAIRHDEDFSYLDFYINMYALYKLNEQGIIEISSFDSSASLSPMKINYTDEIIVPNSGAFVITINKSLEVILSMHRYDKMVGCVFYTKTYEDYSNLNSILRDATIKYNFYENKVFSHDGSFLDVPNITFDDIYLEENIRKEVKENIIDYIDPEEIKIKVKNGLPTKRGLIFVGSPGVGKSYLCKVLATTLKTTFMVVTNIHSLCEINSIFGFASKFKRIIILFEDIDIYIGDREIGSGLLPTMLNELDGVQISNNIIVLCTTNNLKGLDKALRERPGRFDRILKFNSPCKTLKVKMLQGICTNKDVSQVDFETVCEAIPKHYTGAHIKEVYITACNEAIKRKSVDENEIVVLTTDIFLAVIKDFKQKDSNKEDKKRMGFDEDVNG